LQRARKQHEQIKMRLRLAGTSLAQVARDLGVAPTTVTSVSQGARRSRRIEATIAQRLSTTAAKLWPDRYAAATRHDLVSLKSTGGDAPSLTSN
jgi:Ner family transcriptional regulator